MPSETDEPVARHGVVGTHDAAVAASGDGGGDHDGCPVVQVGQRGLHREHRAAKVDAHDAIPLLGRHVLQGCGGTHERVGHHRLQRAGVLQRRRHHLLLGLL